MVGKAVQDALIQDATEDCAMKNTRWWHGRADGGDYAPNE